MMAMNDITYKERQITHKGDNFEVFKPETYC